jgi:uncharacterized membrane protein YqhA
MKPIERLFEGAIWNSRLVIVVAVVASLVVSLVLFYLATADVVFLVGDVSHYAGLELAPRDRLRAKIVAHAAAIIDSYLFATIMIIFALGLYELFIARLEGVERDSFASRLLLINSLDDLKDRLAKVVFLILIVRYFEFALQSDIGSALDLLYLAVGIALVALSLYLTSRSHGEAKDSRS